MGYKMARDGKVPVWEGVWLSSMILLPLGIFLTYKAVGDSAEFKFDVITRFFNRLRGKEMERGLVLKEFRLAEVDADEAAEMLRSFLALAMAEQNRIAAVPKLKRPFVRGPRTALTGPMNQLIDYLSNTTSNYVVALLNQYPFTPTIRHLPAIIETTRAIMDRMNVSQEEPSNNNDNEQ